MKRLAVALASLVLGVLLVEGVLSLGLGTSLRRLVRPRSALERLAEDGAPADRAAALAAARALGPFELAPDPLVANTFRASTEVDFGTQRFRTDALGLRARPGPPPEPGAFHLVVLGDSVAFGDGLASEENLAAQLEAVLREAAPGGARAVACSTVAVPGWNARNSTRHLLDHLDRVAPDLVLFVAVENDLDDAYGVTETGQRRRAPDLAVPSPLCAVTPPQDLYRLLGRQKLGRAGLALSADRDAFQWTLFAGLSRSARWRLDDMAERLERLATRLERVGARLVLAPYVQHPLHRAVRARLIERGRDLPVIPLLDRRLASDGQGKNPHPSVETTRALALWTAETLLAERFLPFEAARALPAVPERLRERRGHELSPAELVRWRAELEASEARRLVARVVPAELEGLEQLYGGLNADGSLGIECALVLPPGRLLRLELAGAAEAPGLYPLRIEVRVDEHALGEVVVPGREATVTAELELGPRQGSAPFEVSLRAGDWALARILERRVPVSARLIRAESLP